MNRLARLTVVILGFAMGPVFASPGEPVIDEADGQPAGYRLVWSDEFDRNGLPDPARWSYDVSRDAWPFGAPQYLLLNIAVGGNWGGQKGVDPAIFPVRMMIDYVRVYQRPD